MRDEARRVWEQLEEGILLKDITGSKKTKGRMYRKWLYQKILIIMLTDYVTDRVTLSTPFLKTIEKQLLEEKRGKHM